jgi:bifunctional DNA-binding transcriptional regulator/antitoxin component of YhaV-PrlF toxin-antitoxin module
MIPRGETMSLVKLKGKGQMTLPVDIREQLSLDEGALLEASVEKGRVVLTPKTIVDRTAAFARMNAIAAKAEKRWQAEGKTDEEMEQLINETVEEVRSERYAKGQTS